MGNEVILNHEGISVTVLPIRGALISDFSVDGQSLLKLTDEFSPDGSGWPAGGIPFLFPVAGRSFSKGVSGRYNAFGKEWPMPIHGFAYGLPWTVKKTAKDSVQLELTSSETTLSLFPWHFRIRYEVAIRNRTLELKTKITNLGCLEDSKAPMPIAPGFHPYFNTSPEGPFPARELQVEMVANTVLRVSAQGGVDKQTDFPTMPTYSLDQAFFANGIFPIKSPATFKLLGPKYQLSVSSPESKYLVFWTKNRDSFQCIEPWLGVPDALGFAEPSHQGAINHPFAAKLLPSEMTLEFSMSLRCLGI
jgi:galactose mutarotase-like enzyme